MTKDNRKINTNKLKRINYTDIIKDTSPIIREISHDVPFPLDKENREIINQMVDYVRSSQNAEEVKIRNLRPAYGISAIQLGHKKKMIFVRIESEYGGEPEEFALVNPKIIEQSSKKAYLAAGESCLSVDEEHPGYILRSYSIKLHAVDYFTNREVEIDARGLTAIVFQHEMDHLLGILFYDRINKLNPFNVEQKAIKIS